MPSQKVQRKFEKYGRKAAFARLAGVSRVTVTLWLRGERQLRRLDRLARDWRPTKPSAASCDRPGCPGAV